jgi:hypothetical protein
VRKLSVLGTIDLVAARDVSSNTVHRRLDIVRTVTLPSRDQPGMTALLTPRGAPERLLGLPVEQIDGQPMLAEVRRPGCEVGHRVIPTQPKTRGPAGRVR